MNSIVQPQHSSSQHDTRYNTLYNRLQYKIQINIVGRATRATPSAGAARGTPTMIHMIMTTIVIVCIITNTLTSINCTVIVTTIVDISTITITMTLVAEAPLRQRRGVAVCAQAPRPPPPQIATAKYGSLYVCFMNKLLIRLSIYILDLCINLAIYRFVWP